MALATRTVRIRFTGDTSNLERATLAAGGQLEKTGGRFDKFKKRADQFSLAVGAAAVAVGKTLVDAASDLQQSMGGVESVFKDNADVVKAWADQAADAVGLSKTEFATLAAPLGASLKAAGFSLDEATAKTRELISRGADLAATFGGTTSDAVQALGAALRGEFDPLERYGIALNQTTVNAELARKGQDKLEGSAAALAQKTTLLELITKQSADATGAFAREADTAAGAAQRSQARWANLTAELGTQLLPAFTQVATFLGTTLIPFLRNNQGLVTGIALALVGLAVAWGVVRVAMAAWHAITLIATVAQLALNAAMHATPIGIVITAIAALVAAFIVLWNTSEGFRNFFIGAWNTIRNVVGTVVQSIIDRWNGLMDFFRGVPDFFKGIGQGIADGITNGVKAGINFLIDLLNGLINALNVVIAGINAVNPFSDIPPIPRVRRLARGGLITQGGLAMVGERGRELVSLPAGARVHSNPATEAMLDGGRPIEVRVFIGDQELKGMVRTEITETNRGVRRSVLAGVGGAR